MFRINQKCKKYALNSPPSSSWMVFTDSVSHAAMAGQYLLEQTFYLPYTEMFTPEHAPQAIVQSMIEQN